MHDSSDSRLLQAPHCAYACLHFALPPIFPFCSNKQNRECTKYAAQTIAAPSYFQSISGRRSFEKLKEECVCVCGGGGGGLTFSQTMSIQVVRLDIFATWLAKCSFREWSVK